MKTIKEAKKEARKIMSSNGLTFATIWAIETEISKSYNFNFDNKPIGHTTTEQSVKRTVKAIIKPLPNLSSKNLSFLKELFAGNIKTTGKRIEAIYKLIQSKGTPIKSDFTGKENFNGVMCYEIEEGEYIAIKKTGSKDSFFPCSIQLLSITDL